MNKVINININGMIFHIDEEAFVVLDRYLESLKQHFRNNEGGDEILADIESRIAEMLTEMLKDRIEVVSMANVRQVIATMGKPEDMDDADSSSKSNSYNYKWNYNYGFNPGKRMYRDKDNKIIGGVCSGISEYLGLDPVWLRLLFVAVFFGFGIGLLIYIILWIIVPAAKSPSEKLEMRGERVNISNIEKTVTENLDAIKQRFDKEFSRFEGKDFGDKIGHFFEGLFEGMEGAMRGVLHVIGWFFSLVFVVISACVLIAVLSAFFGASGFLGFMVPTDFFDFFHNPHRDSFIFVLALVVIGLPFLGLMLRSLRYMSGYRRRNRFASGFFSTVWVLALIALIVLGFGSFSRFRSSYSYSTSDILKKPTGDTLFLSANGNKTDEIDSHGNGYIDMRRLWNNIPLAGDTNGVGLVSFDITRSDDQNIRLVKHYRSRGSSANNAAMLARSIQYRYMQRDSLVFFDDAFKIPKSDKWNDQSVGLELQIPDGTVVKMRKDMDGILYDIDNVEDMDDDDMPSHTWEMKQDGLTCMDCGTGRANWNDNKNDSSRHVHRKSWHWRYSF